VKQLLVALTNLGVAQQRPSERCDEWCVATGGRGGYHTLQRAPNEHGEKYQRCKLKFELQQQHGVAKRRDARHSVAR